MQLIETDSIVLLKSKCYVIPIKSIFDYSERGIIQTVQYFLSIKRSTLKLIFRLLLKLTLNKIYLEILYLKLKRHIHFNKKNKKTGIINSQQIYY